MNNDLLTPEEYAQLLSLGAENAGADDQIKQQLAMAQRLREGNNPQTQMYGRVAVAPHWTQLASGLFREGMAGQEQRMAQQSMQGKTDRLQQQQALILRALQNGQQAQQGVPDAAGGGLRLPGQQPPASALGEWQSPFRFGGQ